MSRRLLKLILSSVLLFSLANPAQGVQGSSQGREPELSLVYSEGGKIILKLDVPFYQISQEEISGEFYERISIPRVAYSDEAGKPQLPVVSALIGIPASGEAALDIVQVNTRQISGRHVILPAPTPVGPVEDFQPVEWKYVRDKNAYRADGNYPDVQARLADEAWLRDQRMVRVEFFPFQYNPVNGELTFNRNIEVEIRFMDSEAGPASSTILDNRNESPFEQALKGSLLNYDQARGWRALPQELAQQTAPEGNDISPAHTDATLPGPRYKISISQDGIYRLSYDALVTAGVIDDDAVIDPAMFRMTSQGEEVAIYIDNSDGNPLEFSSGEYILFYGQRFYGDRLAEIYADEDLNWRILDIQEPGGSIVEWAPQFNAKMLEKYTDENVYWLTYGGEPGLQMPTVNGTPGSASLAETYRETVRAEQAHIWRTTLSDQLFPGSEDTWYWNLVEVSSTTPIVTTTYTTTLSAVAMGTYTATLRGEMLATTRSISIINDHHTKIYLNDDGPVVDEIWDGKSRFAFEVEIPQSELISGENQVVYVAMSALTSDKILFDWFEIEFEREFIAEDDQIVYGMDVAGSWQYQIEGFSTQDVAVLDISNPSSPKFIMVDPPASGTLSYEVENLPGAEFIAAKWIDIEDTQIEYYDPPDFSSEADYLLVTHQIFTPALQALAAYRASQGISTQIIDIEDLYNQFNYGIYHPIAIKNFLRYTFSAWSNPPTYVVLVGDGHWNFKGYSSPNLYGGYDASTIYIPPNLAWVDPWQGEVDSANLLATVVGDDPIADIIISRLPVRTPDELNAIINKISNYENAPEQSWQRRLMFVADNKDSAGDFPDYAEGIIDTYLVPGYSVDRIYEEYYGCTVGSCPAVNYAITNTLNITGTLIVNYIGHGALNRWSHESIFVNSDIATLSNGAKLPVILSMTCWDGYWVYPGQEGLIEELLRANGKGAVAAFSPTGLGVATGHDHLHKGFYDSLFVNGNWSLGAASMTAKLRLFTTGTNYDLLHTFTLFGDPALKISNQRRFYLFLPAIKN